jgi:hypothetical protein
MNIISSPKVARSQLKPLCLLWEALICEKLIPKPAPKGTIFLPWHVNAVPWYHVKFHEFQTSFQFTKILKPCISILAAKRQCQGVWHSFSFLACDLSLQPRTHIWFFNPFYALEHVHVVQFWIMHINAYKTQLTYKNVQTIPEKFPNLTRHSCCSMLTPGKKLKARRGDEYCFVHKGDMFP